MSQAGQAGSTPPGGGPVNDIAGDTGTTVSGHVKIYGHTGSANAGITVGFNGSSTTELDLVVTDVNNNTLIGKDAGNATMGVDGLNVGVGSSVLHALTTGQGNIALGVSACTSVTQGTDNVGIGTLALGAVTTGLTNIGIGHYAGRSVVTGTGNIFAGYSTGTNVTGDYNTAVGHNALLTAVGASNNIALGKSAGLNYTTTESSNILIGNQGTVGESNVMRLGTQGSGAGQVNTAYAAGIVGNTVSNAQQVTINSSTGQLGVSNISSNVFAAHLSSSVSNVTGDGTAYTIIFDTVDVDQGSNYNNATGVFTAPLTGSYQFNSTICFTGTPVTATSFWNGSAFAAYMAAENGNPVVNVLSSCCIIKMTAGDTMSIQAACYGGALNIGVAGGTLTNSQVCLFSGYLIG